MAQIAQELAIPAMPAVPRVASLPRWRVVLWLVALTTLGALLAGSWLGYIGSVSTSSYNMQRLHAERDAWRTRNDQLRVELSKARSLAFVEHEAVTRLQMRKPSEITYLVLEPLPGQAVPGVRGAAAPR